MSEKIVFRLKRLWKVPGKKPVDLYKAIKAGQKTSEFRNYTAFWKQRLCPGLDFQNLPDHLDSTIDVTKFLKVRIAWFIVGYPKNNLPRLETEITKLVVHLCVHVCMHADQFEIQFQNVKEITACMQDLGLEGIPDLKLAELIEGGATIKCS